MLRFSFQILITFLLVATLSACQSGDFDADSGLNEDNFEGDVKISLAHPSNAATADYELVVSTKKTGARIIVCTVPAGDPCTDNVKDDAGRPQSLGSNLIYISSNRHFFRADGIIALEDQLDVTIKVLDDDGTAIDRRVVQFVDSQPQQN